LKDIIENYKNFDKKTKKNNKKSKEEGSNWSPCYYHWKKNYKLDLKDKTESNKNFDKKTKEIRN
jgi:hypothetical protein